MENEPCTTKVGRGGGSVFLNTVEFWIGVPYDRDIYFLIHSYPTDSFQAAPKQLPSPLSERRLARERTPSHSLLPQEKNAYLGRHELLGDVLLEDREDGPEPATLLAEQRRLGDAAGEQSAHHHAVGREPLVHLPHHENVAHFGVFVRLHDTTTPLEISTHDDAKHTHIDTCFSRIKVADSKVTCTQEKTPPGLLQSLPYTHREKTREGQPARGTPSGSSR